MLTFHNNYSLHGEPGTISTVSVINADTNHTVGHLVHAYNEWALFYAGSSTQSEAHIRQILDRLHCMNKKPFTAPPEGYYKCLACGVEIKRQENIPYKDQCACPNHICDGQLFCNEFKGWANTGDNSETNHY